MSYQIFFSKRIFKVVYWVGCIVFIAWLSMLSVANNLQSDYRIYEAAYIGIPVLGIDSCQGMELGWCVPAMVMSHYDLPYSDVAFFFSFVIYGLILYFLIRCAQISGVSVFYVGAALMVFSVAFLRPEMASHLTRQYIAAALLLLAVLALQSSGPMVWVWFVFAVMFHISAFSMLPIITYIRKFGFELKKLLGLLCLLTGLLFLTKLELFQDFVSWGLAINIEPRILYNILYKIKHIAQQEDALPFWKFAVLCIGLCGAIPFMKNINVKIFFYCYTYVLWLMAVAYIFFPFYFVRFFHYEKTMLFGIATVIAFELLSRRSNHDGYVWRVQK
jgi:hypothetical protein